MTLTSRHRKVLTALPEGLKVFVFEGAVFLGEVESIMWSKPPLPCLAAVHRVHNEHSVLREESQVHRTRAAKDPLWSRFGRKETSEKLTKTHNDSGGLRDSENNRTSVYYPPRAFEELQGLEDEP